MKKMYLLKKQLSCHPEFISGSKIEILKRVQNDIILRRYKKIFKAIFIFLLLPIIIISGCKQDKNLEQPDKKMIPKVKVVKAKISKISKIEKLVGEIAAKNKVTISSTVEGPIVFCPWNEGDAILKGTKLVQIRRPSYEKEVDVAAASLLYSVSKLKDLKAGFRPEEISQIKENIKEIEESMNFARNDMDRIEKLVKNGALSEESFDKAKVTYTKYKTQLESTKERLKIFEKGPTKTMVAVQEAAVREAREKLFLTKTKLSECIISSPFNGVISKVYVKTGDTAAPRSPLLEIYDPSSLVIQFAVSEINAMDIYNGMGIDVTIDAYPDIKYKTRIIRVYPQLDQNTRTRTVEAKFTNSIKIIQGMFVRIDLPLKTFEKAVVIPESAVITKPNNENVVFVVDKDKVVMKTVKIGIEQDNSVQILQGIKPGDIVVTQGNEKLKERAEVQIMGQKNKESK